MTSESRKCLALCLCFLFLGVLIGISIDAKFRPNHIRFWVNAGQDLSLVFLPGDTIEWRKLTKNTLWESAPVETITFPGSMPCVDGNTNPCIVDKIPETTTYYYTCTAADGTNCNDPQGGPISATQGLEGPGFFTRIFDLIQNIVASFRHIFSHSPKPGTPGAATQNSASSIATGLVTANAKSSSAYPNIYPELSCNFLDTSNVTRVSVGAQSADSPIQAHVGQNILWGTSSEKGFTVTTDPSTCTQNVSTFGPNDSCTVASTAAKPASFSAIAPPCMLNTNESIVLLPTP
jgi:hypothetical protein